jgi:starch phosphorylase
LRLLPRHLEIIHEINRRFLDQVRVRVLGDDDRVARMSLIDEAGRRKVRMAHLAAVGRAAINGVAALHTSVLSYSNLAPRNSLLSPLSGQYMLDFPIGLQQAREPFYQFWALQ